MSKCSLLFLWIKYPIGNVSVAGISRIHVHRYVPSWVMWPSLLQNITPESDLASKHTANGKKRHKSTRTEDENRLVTCIHLLQRDSFYVACLWDVFISFYQHHPSFSSQTTSKRTWKETPGWFKPNGCFILFAVIQPEHWAVGIGQSLSHCCTWGTCSCSRPGPLSKALSSVKLPVCLYWVNGADQAHGWPGLKQAQLKGLRTLWWSEVKWQGTCGNICASHAVARLSFTPTVTSLNCSRGTTWRHKQSMVAHGGLRCQRPFLWLLLGDYSRPWN